MWEVYCGELDPRSKEDTQFAADIGRQMQDKEKDFRQGLLGGELPRLQELAKKIQGSSAKSEDKAQAKELMESVEKEGKTLQALENGVILRGSNHPFVQFAIECAMPCGIAMTSDAGTCGRSSWRAATQERCKPLARSWLRRWLSAG